MEKDALFLDEMHPTVAGHQLMGQALAEVLTPWAAGETLSTGGSDASAPAYADPFVQGKPRLGGDVQTLPAFTSSARVQGSLHYSAHAGAPITISALATDGSNAQHSIVLDQPGPFMLPIGTLRQLVLQVQVGEQTMSLSQNAFSLEQGAVESILIDLDQGTIRQR